MRIAAGILILMLEVFGLIMFNNTVKKNNKKLFDNDDTRNFVLLLFVGICFGLYLIITGLL